MGSHPGKPMRIIGGILAILATYLLVLDSSGRCGLNIIFNIPGLFASIDVMVIISLILDILLLIGGILMLVGRVPAIIFSIVPLVLSIFLLLGAFNISLGIDIVCYFDLAGSNVLVPGILPFSLDLVGMGIGTIVLLIGSLLGFLGGIID